MLSHRQRAAWYHQLAQQLEAGLPFAEAVRAAAGTGVPASGLEMMAAQIESGGTIRDAFAAAAPWLPEGERQVLTAAAEAGRLPRSLESLAERHAQLAAVKFRLALACAYPLAVVHLGLLLLPVVSMIDWETGFHWDTLRYAHALAVTLGPLWAIALGLLWLMRRQNPVLLAVARRLPFLGRYVAARGLSDFAFALGNFLDAGMPIDRAWAAAGTTSALPELRRAAQSVDAVIARGARPGPMLGTLPGFPPDFVALYRTGETSGQLEQNLLRLAAQYQEQAGRALTLLSLFYPAVVFAAVAVAVAFNVIRIYAGYLSLIEKLGS
jgi:type II secretory pathway component PulF